MIEVLYAYAKLNDITQKDINKARSVKNEKRGNFSDNIFLVSIEKPLTEEEIKQRTKVKELEEQLRNGKHTSTIITVGY